MTCELRLDLAEFHAEAAQFDLTVEAPEEFDFSFGVEAGAVACAVKAFTLLEWMFDELLRGEFRAVVISERQAVASQE